MEKDIKISILLKPTDMFNFLMRHMYTSFAGIFGVLISITAFVLFIAGFGQGNTLKNVLLLIGASLFTIINPLQLWSKAKAQIKKNPMFKEPLNYTFNEEGIVVSQKEEKLEIQWTDVRKVIETKKDIIVYLSTIHAYILPKDQFKQECNPLKELMKTKISKKTCKLK